MTEESSNGTPPDVIPAGIRAAQAALRKDLPELLAKRRYRGKFAAYSKDGQVAIGNNYLALIRECVKRGLPDDAYIVEQIEPGAGSDEIEEIESNWW